MSWKENWTTAALQNTQGVRHPASGSTVLSSGATQSPAEIPGTARQSHLRAFSLSHPPSRAALPKRHRAGTAVPDGFCMKYLAHHELAVLNTQATSVTFGLLLRLT